MRKTALVACLAAASVFAQPPPGSNPFLKYGPTGDIGPASVNGNPLNFPADSELGGVPFATSVLPSQTTHGNKGLFTNGTSTSWANTPTGWTLSGATNTFSSLPFTAFTNYATSTLALADPNADRLLLWDDSEGAFVWVDPATLGGGVSDGDMTDVTISGSGTVYTVDPGAITLAKMANMATGSLIYRKTVSTGAPEVNSLATLKTDLGLTGTNSGDQTISLTGDVTGSGTGSFAASIASGAVGTAELGGDITAFVKGALVLPDAAALRAYVGATGSWVIRYHADGTSTSHVISADTDAARGSALQAAVTAHAATDKRIVTGPGTFLLSGTTATVPLLLRSGVHLEGHATTIKVDDLGASAFPYSVFAISSQATGQNGTKVSGIHFNLNLAGQSATNAALGAVQLFGSNCVLEDVSAENYGSKFDGVECFVFAVGTYKGAGIGYNNKIRNAICGAPAAVLHLDGTTFATISGGGSLTGAEIYTPGDGWVINSEISGVEGRNITAGTLSGQPEYFHLITMSASLGGSIQDNYAYNLLGTSSSNACAVVYHDTFSLLKTRHTGNNFINVNYGWWLQTTNDAYVIADQDFTDNTVVVSGTNPMGIIVTGRTGGHASDVRINGNTLLTGTIDAGGSHGIRAEFVDGLSAMGNTIECTTPFNTNDLTLDKYRFNYDTSGAVVGTPTPLTVAEGGTNGGTAATARTGLGATTVGANIFTLANPSAIRFIRIDAANTVTARSATDFRADLNLAETGVVEFESLSIGGDDFAVDSAGIVTAGTWDAGDVAVPTEAYDATGWNGDLTVPTKDAVRDKIETLSGGGLASTDIDTLAELNAIVGDADLLAVSGVVAQTITLAPASNTVATGLLYADVTAATSGNQQYSPATRWTGQGWKTTATAASQAVDFQAYVVPVQGTTAPSGKWTLASSINGGAFANSVTVDSAGAIATTALGTAALSAIQIGQANNGIYSRYSGALNIGVNGNATIEFGTPAGEGVKLNQSAPLTWSSSGISGVPDIGISRNAAGVVEINSATAGAWRDLKVRQHYVDQTITAGGTTGAQTINKAAGTINFATGTSTLVVTNSLVTTNSTVYCSVRTNDAAALIKNVVPAAGSFTITLNAATGAETSVGFFVVN